MNQEEFQRITAKAHLILEYLKATSFDRNSGLLDEETLERRERLSKIFEEVVSHL